MKHKSRAVKLEFIKEQMQRDLFLLAQRLGPLCSPPAAVTDHEPRRGCGSWAEAPGPERELPALGMEQRCYEMLQPNSLFLLGAYKAQMCGDV